MDLASMLCYKSLTQLKEVVDACGGQTYPALVRNPSQVVGIVQHRSSLEVYISIYVMNWLMW